MKTDTEKDVKKVKRAMQDSMSRGPASPLKNYHKGYLADPNGIRDTPLVPKGTVADYVRWFHIFLIQILIHCAGH